MGNEFLKKSHNPNFKKHGIQLPFRLLVVGSSGSGKSNTALQIIHLMSDTFEKIVIMCKDKHEPLYEYLESKIDPEHLEFFEISKDNPVPPMEQITDGTFQSLVIFDDLVLDRKQDEIEQYFIRGRKKSISMMYLSQSYFRCPKTIRLQCNYILFKKIASNRDLKMILQEYNLGVDIKALMKLFKYATKDRLGFLLIDCDNDDEQKFRSGFKEILKIQENGEPTPTGRVRTKIVIDELKE